MAQYGSPESNPAFWASISPSSYLADLSGPLQLHHGTADESVPTEFSQTLYQQAQEAKLSVPVEYYEYPGDNHNLSKSFNTAMQRSIAFFDKYVKNAAQPAAADDELSSRSPMPQTLLALFAHPDDEAFGTGGTLSQYAAAGADVTLVCTTRGEVGEIAEGTGATPETLGEVREAELRCAAETVGVRELIFLGYRDSGMAGTPENADPRAYVNASSDEVVPRLVGIIRRVRPQVVITFEPNGGYGHPDHIAIHHHTVAAFHAAADGARYPEQGPAWQAPRLFYTAIPRSFFLRMRDEMAALGMDTSGFARFEEGGGGGWPDEQVNVVMDVADAVEAKWSALNCHRTQFGPGNLFRRLPEPTVKEMMRREYFALAWPEPEPGARFDDLFDGV